jgi:hypothetical protein
MIAPRKVEFGDFQTPEALAFDIVEFLRKSGIRPAILIEPTCGKGSFVFAAIEKFPSIQQVIAYDINEEYIKYVSAKINNKKICCDIAQQDFYKFDWKMFISNLDGDILFLGNPPWVNNSTIGAAHGNNLPVKNNFQKLDGFAAKTGKSNFDISEWMLIKILESLENKSGWLAMLCKTAIARKVIKHAWNNRYKIGKISLHLIDAKKYFGASVDACLLLARTGCKEKTFIAKNYSGLNYDDEIGGFGLVGDIVVSNLEEYKELKEIDGISCYAWRSGLKHDAASVMEISKDDNGFKNSSGEHIDIEETLLYPLAKSSDLANGRIVPEKYVIVTQKTTGDDTSIISKTAPKTWDYLLRNSKTLDGRKSIIYKKRARFSVFGVGSYTFAPWKVAVSGLYKNIHFTVVGKYDNKPVILDDTCYFISCKSQEEANFICNLLNSETAQRFIKSMIFLDSKRPLKTEILNRINLHNLAKMLGVEDDAKKHLKTLSLIS